MNHEKMSKIVMYDAGTGSFRWLEAKPGRQMGREAGTVGNGRRKLMIAGKQYHAHRIAWLLIHGEWPKGDIDHIDGNPLNNRISNLRDVSRSVNMQNLKRARCDSESGMLGVTVSGRGGFISEICLNGKRKYLGKFASPAAAHDAYVAAKREMHEGCTL